MRPAPLVLRRAAAALVAALVMGALLASTAAAGTYDVASCADRLGGSLKTGAWTVQRLKARRTAFRARDNCDAGVAMRGELRAGRTLARGAGAQFVFRAPGNATLTRLVFERRVQTLRGFAYQLYALVGARRRAVPLERCFAFGCTTVSRRGGVNGALPNGTRAIVARVSCRPPRGRVCPRRAHRLFGQLRVSRTVVTVEDIRRPVFVRASRGPLTSTAAQAGVRTIKVEASDAGGGLRALEIVVDGRKIVDLPFSSLEGASCGIVVAGRAACPNRSVRTFKVDTARLANGPHALVLRLRDAAGNTTSSTRQLFSTNNPGSPGIFLRLTAGLGSAGEGSRRRFRKLRYGSPATLAGLLKDAQGAGVANARIRITPRIGGPRGPAQPVVETVTDTTGRYRISVRVGPSRSFEVRSFRGAVVSAVARADLAVTAPVRLRASRLGRRVVRLRGSIPADPRPSGGAFVEIQAKAGRRFVPFRVLRTDPRGTFALTYRFRGRGTFRLRAVVRHQAGLPFATGRSAAKRFLVR